MPNSDFLISYSLSFFYHITVMPEMYSQYQTQHTVGPLSLESSISVVYLSR